MIKGIIFDLDGTLIDSMEIWQDIDTRFLTAHGIAAPDGLSQALKAMSSHQASNYIRDSFPLRMTAEEIQAEISGMIEVEYLERISARAGAGEFLELMGAQGIRLCVATASDDYLAEGVLRRLGMLPCFEFIVTCRQLACGKDSPDIYDYAAEQLGLEKQEVLIFEDALHCVETAKRAGYQVIGIYDQTADRDGDIPSLRNRCDRYITGYEELLEDWKEGIVL